jgi:hypothetical protein
MNLSGVVAVSGKPGLFKVLGQNKAGFLLQGLEGDGAKVMVSNNARLAALDETTVYGNGEDLLLKDILLSIQTRRNELTIPDPKSEAPVLRDFFLKICPNHDQERVYSSDLKKIISWYRIIEKLPLFDEPSPKDKELEESSSEPGSDKGSDREAGNSDLVKTGDSIKIPKKIPNPKSKIHESHDKESINTKTGTKNVTHAVRKVNTGANKKAK